MADVVAEPRDLIREEDAAERLSELLASARLEVAGDGVLAQGGNLQGPALRWWRRPQRASDTCWMS